MTKNHENSFEKVVQQHLGALRAYAKSITSTSWLADEAVQETLIRAWRYWPSFRGDASALTWLITICRHVVIDLASKVQPVESLPENVDFINAHTDNHHHDSKLWDNIKDLPLPQREVLVLCLVVGFDYAEASQILGIPIGTVRSRLSRARETLSSHMRPCLREAQ